MLEDKRCDNPREIAGANKATKELGSEAGGEPNFRHTAGEVAACRDENADPISFAADAQNGPRRAGANKAAKEVGSE